MCAQIIATPVNSKQAALEMQSKACWEGALNRGAERSSIELLPCGFREKGCSSGDGRADRGPTND